MASLTSYERERRLYAASSARQRKGDLCWWVGGVESSEAGTEATSTAQAITCTNTDSTVQYKQHSTCTSTESPGWVAAV